MTEARWEPNPDWSPEVKRFTTGLYLYLMTLPEDERRQFMQDMAVSMMEGTVTDEATQ